MMLFSAPFSLFLFFPVLMPLRDEIAFSLASRWFASAVESREALSHSELPVWGLWR